MTKKIYIYLALSIILSWSSCNALIQVTDGIFDNSNTTTKITNTTTATGSAASKTSTGTISSGSNTNKIIANKTFTGELKTNLGTGLEADIDFVMGLKWMYENGLTSYKDVNKYRPYDKVTREEMAKILSKLYDVEGLDLESSESGCVFKDSKTFDTNMSPYIYKVCSLGIMKGSNGSFSANKTITRSQGLVTVLRMFEGKNLDEKGNPWYKSYYDRGIQLGFIPNTMKLKDMEMGLSRYRVAKLVYTFHVQNNFKGSIPQIDSQNYINFVDLVTDSVFLDDDKNYIMKLHIQKGRIINGSTSELPILLDNGSKFKAIKITTTQRTADKNSFVRYADVYDMNNGLAGSMTVIYSDGNIKEGFIRFNGGSVYKINPAVDSSSDNIYDVIKKKY